MSQTGRRAHLGDVNQPGTSEITASSSEKNEWLISITGPEKSIVNELFKKSDGSLIHTQESLGKVFWDSSWLTATMHPACILNSEAVRIVSNTSSKMEVVGGRLPQKHKATEANKLFPEFVLLVIFHPNSARVLFAGIVLFHSSSNLYLGWLCR